MPCVHTQAGRVVSCMQQMPRPASQAHTHPSYAAAGSLTLVLIEVMLIACAGVCYQQAASGDGMAERHHLCTRRMCPTLYLCKSHCRILPVARTGSFGSRLVLSLTAMPFCLSASRCWHPAAPNYGCIAIMKLCALSHRAVTIIIASAAHLGDILINIAFAPHLI